MRKLLVVVVPSCLTLVPAALAATGPAPVERPEAAAELTASHPLEPVALGREARSAHRRAQQKARPKRERAAVNVPPALEAIAQCESGSNPRAIGGGGQFRGKYQFTLSTWAGVGGKGDPAAAPEAEQDRRAAILYARSGPGQWPVCGQ